MTTDESKVNIRVTKSKGMKWYCARTWKQFVTLTAKSSISPRKAAELVAMKQFGHRHMIKLTNQGTVDTTTYWLYEAIQKQ
jgi:hypothetical protein